MAFKIALCQNINYSVRLFCQPMPIHASVMTRRWATGFKRRMRKQEDLKKVVFQYASDNLKKSDRIYTWGYAATGALGVRDFLRPEKGRKTKRTQRIPFRLDFFEKYRISINQAAAGNGFSLFACEVNGHEHVLYGSGINTDSQLGYHEYPRRTGRILDYLIEPAPVPLPLKSESAAPKITHLACGRAHSVIRTEFGIYMLGNNSAGQCGRTVVEQEIYKHSQVMHKLDFLQPVRDIVCGQDHTMILTENGEVYSCGLGADGQTGLGHYDNTGELSQVKGDIKGERIIQLASKSDCVLAVSDKGDVFGWGNNEYDQLASANPSDMQVCQPVHLPFKDIGRVVKVASSGAMCALVNEAGHVFVWGFGLLGQGPNTQKSTWPAKLPHILFGETDFNENVRVIDIECGMNFFGAITNRYEVYVWGNNRHGNLGLGHLKDQYFPFQVHLPAEIRKLVCGVDHCFALCKTFL